MTTPKSKPGRKQKSHRCSWDNATIDGLYHCPDGRWRITSTGQKFTEPDERRAVARFLQLTAPHGTLSKIIAAAGEAVQIKLPSHRLQTVESIVSTVEAVAVETGGADGGHNVHFDLTNPPTEWSIDFNAHEGVIWAWVRDQLITRKKYVAQRIGIEQIAYLDDLKPPEKLPSFSEMIALWNTNAKCNDDQKRKVQTAFEDFVATTKIGSIKDVTPDVVCAFQDKVYARIVTPRGGVPGPISPKQQAHIFGGIKTLLRSIKRRGKAVRAISEALDCLSILQTSDTSDSSDPNPIEIPDWKKLLGKATGENLAMILLMLNGAYYLREVIHLNWSEIDWSKGTITTNRRKTGKCIRVCVLWPETIAALKALPQVKDVDAIFRNYTGTRLGISGAQMRFNDLADLAGVGHVTGSQLRDGAFSAAVEANVQSRLCDILVGHRSGMSDKYVKRNPKMVAPACEAIHHHFWAKAE